MAQRILVVDDDRSIVKVIGAYLEQSGYQVLTAYDGEMALYTLRRERPDLLILDLMMPNRDGWSVTQVVRSDPTMAATPIIMLTARVEDTDKIVGLELGADDYITKPFNIREVIARVRALLRRSNLGQTSGSIAHVLVVGGLRLDLDQRLLAVDGRPVELTRTEFNLLETFLSNPGYTLTRDDLLEKALGYAYEGMGRVLDTHIRNLRRKIEPDSGQTNVHSYCLWSWLPFKWGSAMNRLWVRLSLMLSGVLFLMFFLQFLEIMFVPDEPVQTSAGADARGGPLDEEPDQAEIALRLLEFMGLSLVVGLVGGIVIARVVSAPITELATAANRIGTGKLDVRVPVRGSRELRDLSESFNRMAADLQHAEKLRNNLMADVSHELRTPLTVLEGNLRAALDRVYALGEAEIANLYGQTRHLIRLVNDLRELALAESGQLSLEKTPTALHMLVSETLQALEPLAAEKEVLLLNHTGDFPPVSIDPFRIRQVLFNLLTNALRHTPPGGSITIDAMHGRGMVTVSIRDTGDGLEPEQLASVFDRFYRADKSRSRETGGTGLGLAIVKAIVDAHHGHVEASSAGRGLGSQFSIHLPLAVE